MRQDTSNPTPLNNDDAKVNIGGVPVATPGGSDEVPSNETRPESSESDRNPPSRVKPPAGYPDHLWHNEGHFAVDIELRPHYVQQADAGTGSIAAWRNVPKDTEFRVPQEDGGFRLEAPTYELWAHVMRRDAARVAKDRIDAAAEHVRRTHVECVVCGLRDSFLVMRRVQVGDVDAFACRVDAPPLEMELRSREPLASGRSRAEAVRATADRLMPDGTLPPLELRDPS